jgi:hypothetical protein
MFVIYTKKIIINFKVINDLNQDSILEIIVKFNNITKKPIVKVTQIHKSKVI